MIKLMKRILAVSGKYKRRIQLAFVFSFLKSLLAKAPIMLAFLALAGFYEGTLAAVDCLWYGIAMAACVLLQVVFHHIADRLQSAAGFMVFSDMRMELGAHLRRMPMGYLHRREHRQDQLGALLRHGVHRGKLHDRAGGYDELHFRGSHYGHLSAVLQPLDRPGQRWPSSGSSCSSPGA